MSELRIGIIGNPARNGIESALDLLFRELETLPLAHCAVSPEVGELVTGSSRCSVAPDNYSLVRGSDVVFALGGDGTMLGASRAIMRANPVAKLLGINLGKLGFIAENPPSVIPRLIEGLRNNSLVSERRLVVSAQVTSEETIEGRTVVKHDDLEPSRQGTELGTAQMLALNEIVIDNFGSTRMLTFEVTVNGALLGVMRADGLIVATPTGSTGYAVSAGGPIVEPTAPVMVITPIAPHSLNIRPIIVDERSEIVIRATSNETRQALVVSDGQEEVVADTTARVTVTSFGQKLNLLRLPDNSYFDLLREKMFWSIDPVEGTKGRR